MRMLILNALVSVVWGEERVDEKRNQMWRELVNKIDNKKTPQEFWKDILGRKRNIRADRMKNENGVDLKTGEEIERAFRSRLVKTFRITEEENKENERLVEEWIILKKKKIWK